MPSDIFENNNKNRNGKNTKLNLPKRIGIKTVIEFRMKVASVTFVLNAITVLILIFFVIFRDV